MSGGLDSGNRGVSWVDEEIDCGVEVSVVDVGCISITVAAGLKNESNDCDLWTSIRNI